MTRADADLRRLADEQAALRRVAVLVAEGVSPDQVFAAVAEEVAHLLDVPAISMLRFEPDETSTAIAVWGDENPFGVGATFEPWPGVMLQVRRTGRPARLEDFASSTGPTTARLQVARIHSGVGVPINVDGRVWGTIIALATGGDSLPAGIEERLSSFTELVATAIANAQARDDLRKVADGQAALRRVATMIARQVGPEELFAAVARESARILAIEQTSVLSFEPDGSSTLLATSAPRKTFAVGDRYPPHAGVIAEVWRTGRPAFVEYADVPGELAARLVDEGLLSALGIPILANGSTWGVLIALATRSHPLPEDAEARLIGFTDLVVTAVSNAQARDELDVFVREQEALRRVATIAATGASPSDVFSAVVDEVKELLDLPVVALTRYEPDGTVLMMAAAGAHPFQAGTRWPLDGLPVASMVLERRAPAHLDEYVTEDATVGDAIRAGRVRSGLAVPIMVDNEVWGTISTASTDQPLPTDAEERLTGFTELVAGVVLNTQARDELRALADEQAALRRVATLVAQGAASPAVYDAICEETGAVIGATSVNLAQFTPDRFNLTMAGWSLRDTHVPVGTRLPIEGGTINELVHESGAPARIDSYADARGALADVIRARGIKSEVGAPVIVDGQVWGMLVAGWDTDGAPPAGAEARLASFAELVATAVSNESTRSELIGSRARIVAAGDEARRRIERNLHDGTQQRLVALGLDLQRLRGSLGADEAELQSGLARVTEELEAILEDVREVSRGLHPGLLSQAGLQPSLRALARKSPIPVELDVDVDGRPDPSIEIAVYYVVSEALTNAAKHARASIVSVTVEAAEGRLRARIEDDGVGGAEMSAGSGLVGLTDRVEALGGRLALDSPPGAGTSIAIDLPLTGRPDGQGRGSAAAPPS